MLGGQLVIEVFSHVVHGIGVNFGCRWAFEAGASLLLFGVFHVLEELRAQFAELLEEFLGLRHVDDFGLEVRVAFFIRWFRFGLRLGSRHLVVYKEVMRRHRFAVRFACNLQVGLLLDEFDLCNSKLCFQVLGIRSLSAQLLFCLAEPMYHRTSLYLRLVHGVRGLCLFLLCELREGCLQPRGDVAQLW